jgi:hypothetical protein
MRGPDQFSSDCSKEGEGESDPGDLPEIGEVESSITETGLGVHQMGLCLIDLIRHKGENSVGLKDSIHGNRVGAAMVITTSRDLPLVANPSMIPAYQPAGSEG